jgi:hypothetical protein
MIGIPFTAVGTVYEDDRRTALLLSIGSTHYTLRLGFIVRGTEKTFLPETLLDDWGHEIGGAALYLWVKENAEHFPRAEIFGLDLTGQPRQCFLRELDLTAKYACYVFQDSTAAAVEEGNQLTEILVPATVTGHRRMPEAPAKVPFPLRDANVEWWTVDRAIAQVAEYDFFRRLEQDESK